MQILVGSLIAFLSVLIVSLFALSLLILRMDRLTSIARAGTAAVAPLAATASRSDLTERLELLRRDNEIARIEIYRGDNLYVAAGERVPSAEVVSRPVPGGTMLFYFDVSGWLGGRRTALIIGAMATLAPVGGLIILILYLPKFLRPLEEMLAQAALLGSRPRGDDDARYLVHTFREAVERIQDQDNELGHLRDAASSRTPDVHALARALNHSLSSGFLALDAAGSVIAMNGAGRSILGLTAEAPAEPFPLSALAAPFAMLLQEAVQGRIAVTRREVVFDDSEVIIGVTTVPLYENENFIGMFALFTDLTTFRAMEARLRDLENLVGLGQMSAGIAHEFRNSLFTILGYLKLALRSASPEAAAKIQSAETEASSLAKAVDALLNFARPLKIKAQKVRLDELVRTLMERYRAETPSVRFLIDTPRICEINGDRDLLERAVENVIRNAIDAVRQRHGEQGGSIEAIVTTEPHPTLIVRDNGVGIDRENAARFLLPFQSGKAHGFGLGLPLARKIVLHHGGTLSLSGTPGEGAVVQMEFFT